MSKIYNFYLLRSNSSIDDIKYIGVTTCSLLHRYYLHKYCAMKKESSLPVYNWWRKRVKSGYDIIIEPLLSNFVGNWEETE